jgi:peptidoglycan/xylan/chitin deacetylase (PgdA/CDA1 family)
LNRDDDGRVARRTTITALAVIVVACTPAPARAAGTIPAGLRATLPAPTVHADPADVRSPLDLSSAAFGQTGARFELRVRTRQAMPLAGLAAGGGRSLCLLVEQRQPLRSQRLCLAVGPGGKLSLREARRRADGSYVAAHTISARVRRSGTDGIVATFTPGAARLTHGRVVWHVSSDWIDSAGCPVPADGAASVCHDLVPDRGGVAVRVHRSYVVGCVPAGRSLRLRGPRTSRQIALTFDDGPGPQTPAVLRILRREHVHATFFELGVQVRLYPALVRQTLAEGHALGNHTWDHKAMTSLSPADADAELTRTSAAIRSASGSAPCLFRPPSGAIDAAVAAIARKRDLLSIVWDVDPKDWTLPGSDAIVRNVLANAHAGSIVLLHDAGGPRNQTLAALPQIIAGLRARHLTFVTVPQLLGLQSRVAWD